MRRPWQPHRFDCMCSRCLASDAPDEYEQAKEDDDREDARIDAFIEARLEKQFDGGPREGEGEVEW